jgi:transposase
MHARHAISDADWDRIKGLLPGRPGQHGGVARDNRLFVNAVLWVARTGAGWRDLPPRFGNWNSIWRRFDRWAAKGAWARVMAALRDEDLEWLILDSTSVRAHPAAAGAKKSGTAAAARRSRRWAAAAAGSGPRSTPASARWGTPSSCG